MAKAYFIDTENQHYIMYQAEMKKGDTAFVLYTKESSNLDEEGIEKLKAAGIEVVLRRCICGGANALDFQLLQMMCKVMYSSSYPRYDAYVIQSCDQGFLALSDMAAEDGFKIEFTNVAIGENFEALDSDEVLMDINRNENSKKRFEKDIKRVAGSDVGRKIINVVEHNGYTRRQTNRYIYGSIADEELRRCIFPVVRRYFQAERNSMLYRLT